MTGTGRRLVWDDRVRLAADASVLLGGAPWAVLRIAPAGRPFLRRLRAAGPAGTEPRAGVEQTLADLLTARGIAHPVVDPASTTPVDVVVPAYCRNRAAEAALERCLAALRTANPDLRVIVVDDCSPSAAVAGIAERNGAILLRHNTNRGPAAARNTGLREVRTPLVAFVDADCAVTPGWLEILAAHLDDPRVVAVAPRIVARPDDDGVLARYQTVRSSLDMGPRPELVAPGAPLGYLPSAALLVRRDAMAAGFDEALRVGEDVDLVWRLVAGGHLVRYEPAATVSHAIRPQPSRWALRVVDYGTSAGELERRHPGRLAPARLSSWNVATLALLLARRPVAAALCTVAATTLLARTLRATSVDPWLAPVITGKGLAADASCVGHLLRREWWPLGWLVLAAAPRRRAAGIAAAAMLVPPAREWLDRRPRLGPASYLGLRLVEDAAYGCGVIVSAVRAGRIGVLLPVVHRPRRRPQRSTTSQPP